MGEYSLSVVLPVLQHKFGVNYERGFHVNSLKIQQNLFNFVIGELNGKDLVIYCRWPGHQIYLCYKGTLYVTLDEKQVFSICVGFPFPLAAREAFCTRTLWGSLYFVLAFSSFPRYVPNGKTEQNSLI